MNLPVRKIELIIPKENTLNILDKLQAEECLEVISESSVEDFEIVPKEDYKLRLSEANFALTFLENFRSQENFIKNLIFSFVPTKETLKEEEMVEIAQSAKIKEVVSSCASIEEVINKLQLKKENLLEERDVLEKFSNTSVFFRSDLQNVEYFAGTVEKKDKESFICEISKKEELYIEEGKEDTFFFNFVLYYPKKDSDYYLSVLKKYSAKKESVFWEEQPLKALERREKELGDVDIELDIQSKEAQKLLFFIPKLQALSDWFSFEIEKKEFLKKIRETKRYIVIKAWAVKETVVKIKELVGKETPYFLIKELPTEEGDNPPVVLRNKGAFESFGIVTGVYGLPKKDEIDPTPYLAPFFIFYFALALSDSGYGFLLVALAFLAKKIFKKANADRFFNLFIFCGILTTVLGFFVGTIFGRVFEFLKIADPLANPIEALLFVLALGVIQIFAGLIIGAVWLIRRGEVKEAISGNGASIAFFIGVILFLITDNTNFIISGVALMVALAFIYSTGEGIFQKVGKALGSLYGIIGYVGDILSYSRILALGLATGIIAMVINMIALIFMEMIPIPGVDLMVAGIILVVGHIGNLLINALGAFIHSARLQFVEFFSRFMEGGGRYFQPLGKNGRYIKIIN